MSKTLSDVLISRRTVRAEMLYSHGAGSKTPGRITNCRPWKLIKRRLRLKPFSYNLSCQVSLFFASAGDIMGLYASSEPAVFFGMMGKVYIMARRGVSVRAGHIPRSGLH